MTPSVQAENSRTIIVSVSKIEVRSLGISRTDTLFVLAADGGSLVAFDASTDRWILVGLTPLTVGNCSFVREPQIFVRIASRVQWILDNVQVQEKSEVQYGSLAANINRRPSPGYLPHDPFMGLGYSPIADTL